MLIYIFSNPKSGQGRLVFLNKIKSTTVNFMSAIHQDNHHTDQRLEMTFIRQYMYSGDVSQQDEQIWLRKEEM